MKDSALQIRGWIARNQTLRVVRFTGLTRFANAEQRHGQSLYLGRIQHRHSAAAHIVFQLPDPCGRPLDFAAGDDCTIRIDRIHGGGPRILRVMLHGRDARATRHQYIENVSKDARHECLSLAAGRLAFAYSSGVISSAEQLAQCAIAAIDLRNFERPMRIIRHLPAVRRIEQERDRRVRRAAIGMLLSKMHKLFSDAPERIQLKRMLPRPRLEKLIETLLEINRGRARHVIEVVTLAIPAQRRTHRGSVTRVKEEVRPGKILLLRKRGRGVAKIWRVIIKEIAAVLARSATRERDPHRSHRLYGGRFHSQMAYAPLSQRVRERSAPG